MHVPSKERESQRQQVSFLLHLSLGPHHTLESLCTESVRHLPPSDFVPHPRPLDSDRSGCKCDHFLSVQVQILCGCIGASSCCSHCFFFFTSLVHALRYSSPLLAHEHQHERSEIHNPKSYSWFCCGDYVGYAAPDNQYVMMTDLCSNDKCSHPDTIFSDVSTYCIRTVKLNLAS